MNPWENKPVSLELRGVVKRFGDTLAVDRVDLSFKAGSFAGIVGSSGAGKSTLLRLINRLIDPSEGELLANDQDVGRLRGRELRLWRSRCAMIFQQFNLTPRLDVLTNVLAGSLSRKDPLAALAGWFTKAEREESFMALESVGMSEFALRRVETLSGGQQQRVAIARAIMQRPSVLLADEPIAALDPKSADAVMELLAKMHQRGLTVLVNLHHVDTAVKFCDRLIGMQDGRVFFDQDAKALSSEDFDSLYQRVTPSAKSDSARIDQKEILST